MLDLKLIRQQGDEIHRKDQERLARLKQQEETKERIVDEETTIEEDKNNILLEISKRLENTKSQPAEAPIENEKTFKAKNIREIHEKRIEAITAAINKIIVDNDFIYLQSSNKFWEYSQTKQSWLKFSKESMQIKYPNLSGSENWDIFVRQMDSLGRLYKDSCYTFREMEDKSIKNFLDFSNWIQPVQGKHHKAFDSLIRSLGGDLQENMDHIERVITHKYMYPANYQLPCILWYGEGSTGKNVIVDDVLNRMFGGMTAAIKGNSILGEFNSSAKGMAVLLLNEFNRDKASIEKLKNLIGQQYLDLNEKFLPVTKIDNTALYFISTNDLNGPITLGRDGSDRRWSVLYLPPNQTLAYYINEDFDLGINLLDLEKLDLSPYFDQAYQNPEQIGKWLNYLIRKWGTSEVPKALHGEHYQQLVGDQKNESDELMEEVFGHDFQFVRFSDLWVRYKNSIDQDNPGMKNYIKKNQFKVKAKNWVIKNRPEFEWRGQGHSYYQGRLKLPNGKITTFEGFARKDKMVFDVANEDANNIISFKKKED